TKKTGTTSLQKVLGANRQKLLAYGYHYPKVGVPHSTQGHHMLAWAVQGGDSKVEILTGKKFDLRTVWADLLAEIESVDADNIILSTEYLAEFVDTQKIQAIKDYLSSYDVKISICLRRQDQYMLSLYAEAVKAGYGKSFLRFIEESRYLCDYAACIARWEEVFGEGSVSIQVFKKGRGNELLKDFFRQIELTDLDVDTLKFSQKKLNISPPGKLIRFLRWCNFLFKDVLSLPLFVRRNLYLYHLQRGKVMKLFSLLPEFPIDDQIMSEPIAQSIMAEFAPMNEAILARYFPDRQGSLFES
ncbi:MAG TPA: hypothetical protein V6D02_08195, partial [Candidatus Obscuribacterales bacterium]